MQTHRRNLSDGDLLHFIERLHERMPRGGDRRSEDDKEAAPQGCGKKKGRSSGAKRTADMLNISSRKVEQALTIITHGSPETKAAVLKNEMSINRAYQKTQAERKKADAESSMEKSEQRVTGENPEAEEIHKHQTSELAATVFISMEHFAALQELGGSFDEHLTSAVERYLESVREQHAESSPETEENDDSDEEYFDPDAFDDNDDEYFEPADFDEDQHQRG